MGLLVLGGRVSFLAQVALRTIVLDLGGFGKLDSRIGRILGSGYNQAPGYIDFDDLGAQKVYSRLDCLIWGIGVPSCN